jgi:hypothetical protein
MNQKRNFSCKILHNLWCCRNFCLPQIKFYCLENSAVIHVYSNRFQRFFPRNMRHWVINSGTCFVRCDLATPRRYCFLPASLWPPTSSTELVDSAPNKLGVNILANLMIEAENEFPTSLLFFFFFCWMLKKYPLIHKVIIPINSG